MTIAANFQSFVSSTWCVETPCESVYTKYNKIKKHLKIYNNYLLGLVVFVLDHAFIPLTLGDAEGHSTGDVRIRQKLETEGGRNGDRTFVLETG